MDDRNDQDWDPIPPINPVFKGVVAAVLVLMILFCLIGLAASLITLTMLVLP